MKRVVISGATGTIGMALIQKFIAENIEVLVLCRENSKHNEYIPDNPLITKCMCSLDEINSLHKYDGEKYDSFFHLAWNGTTGEQRNDMYLQNQNVKYALDAVELAHRLGCKVFLGAGSQAEYGRVEGKLSENTPTFPENGYGIAKLCAGYMTRENAHKYGMRHIWTRILSVYGPYNTPQSMVMSGIYKLLEGERPVYTKGEQIWDYMYSKDAANALFLLANGENDGVYCVGNGSARPLHEYITCIRDVVDRNADIGIGEVPYMPKQVMYLCADINKLTKDTGFVPEWSFEEGIKETVEWCRKQRNGKL